LALNIQTFKTRALTALLFVVVMLVGLLWNFWSFLILFTVIHFGCWFEYLKLVEKIYDTNFKLYYKLSLVSGAFAVMLSCYFGFYEFTGFEIWNYMIPVFALISLVLLIFTVFKIKKNIFSRSSFATLAGVFYISIPLGLLLWLHFNVCFSRINDCGLCLGGWVSLCIIFSIWVNDTMAYLVGSFIGKTPLTKISPKKTWEGTIGGMILCVITIGFLYPLIIEKYSSPLLPKSVWFIIPAICAIFGTLGDLLESKLKRMADVKDSGSFMPGHGGFLDRFDSLLIAVPAVWIYVYFFIN
jgi:phosphatidate cytidylyltransferase